MIRRSAAALGVILLLLVGATRPATAHEVDPSVLTVIDSVEPALPGITIEVGTSVTTQLLLDNTTADPVEVLDDTGQPFLRVGPHGVEANLAAPQWYLSNQPFGGTVPPEASSSAPVRWVTVSAEHAWGWFDHRLHPEPTAGVLGDGRDRRFEVPLRSRGREVIVAGHLETRSTMPRFTAALRAVPPATSGLVVQLLEGRAPGLFVRYDGPGEAVVIGREGEPFLRLGPAGAAVNQHSPTWLFTAQARGEDLDGLIADPTAEPAWVTVGDGPSYAWLEPRALIGRIGERAVDLDWSVAVQIDAATLEIVGRSSARLVAVGGVSEPGGPVVTGGRLALLVALAAVAIGALGWAVRGRG